ncbi:dipeptide epimerase [Thermovenabulum sp.]|uniref:dipeptide epimerase n=1 Tax=Thermovenabulum sp. TaxID=3100335 RepID=UPI003C7DB467
MEVVKTKIVDIKIGTIKASLKKPFITSLRKAIEIEDVVVKIITSEGIEGYGEAAPIPAITGETKGSIIEAIEKFIKPAIIEMNIEEFEEIVKRINSSILHNTSAKAACDIALYDIISKFYKIPLYEFLGGAKKVLESDITISLNELEQMVLDSIQAVNQGFNTLKIKVGGDYKKDILKIKAIREAVGEKIKLRVDANQGWNPKEAIIAANEIAKYDIELLEQPVKAYDLEGLREVTKNSPIPVMADESIFSPYDAFKIISMKAADIINIKLMKCGGIYNALLINSLAESAGIECMIGSMMEGTISVTAAAHLAFAKSNITRCDLDAPFLLNNNPVKGGISYKGPEIIFPKYSGLGIENIEI